MDIFVHFEIFLWQMMNFVQVHGLDTTKSTKLPTQPSGPKHAAQPARAWSGGRSEDVYRFYHQAPCDDTSPLKKKETP